MFEQKNKNPGALAGATGAKQVVENTKLPDQLSANASPQASQDYFWDRRSNSVQPLCALAAVVS